MTIVAIGQVPATGAEADRAGFRDEPRYITGLIETARLVGLRVAGYEAWAAGICALVAAGCLVGMTWLATTLIAPLFDVGPDCGSSLDWLQTLTRLPQPS